MDSKAIAVGTLGHTEEHCETRLHFDVNGKWGGRRAVVGHFANSHGGDQMFLYILVGSYWEVGSPAGQKRGATQWEVAKLLATALQQGVDPNVLYHAVLSGTHTEFTALERALSRVYYSARIPGTGYTLEALTVQLGRLATATVESSVHERAYRLEQIAAIATRMLSHVIELPEGEE